MDVERKYSICKYFIIACFVGFGLYKIYDEIKPVNKTPYIMEENIKTETDIKKLADDAGVSLSSEQAELIKKNLSGAKTTGSVSATVGSVHQVAANQYKQSGSDFAPVVSDEDLAKLPEETPVELKQYHIYAAPKIQREIGVKLDRESGSHISGISYGIKRRITEKGQYIGARIDYDWKDKEAEIWATYSW